MIYQEVKSQVVHEYIHENPLAEEEIIELMIKHDIIDEGTTKIDSSLKSAFLSRYDEVRGEDYFLQWLDGLYKNANITYTEFGQQYIDANLV